ncbi:uncharacterized protein MONBRDRAFT_8326 [Monosiga brevicollis MX1]|uniref:Sulfotransferase family protein n=1 Tax=Monosiga brevicollis TaxID=81824 RepID=A9UZR1_MONBE|nr:uncharacterized protein MONBRDRAFT_8326 [Monosiga brevicollis MX1]EDQ89412.1 predicted protein [Monosiga brevicollis MX1]|eukprot:XP_001745988.1 hypothetical protein [Monosiga brevicollis MX1]
MRATLGRAAARRWFGVLVLTLMWLLDAPTAAPVGADAWCVPPEPGPLSVGASMCRQHYAWIRRPAQLANTQGRGSPKAQFWCVVSRRHRFVYHYIPLNGGSTINHIMRLSIGGLLPDHDPADKLPEVQDQAFSRLGEDALQLFYHCQLHEDTANFLHFAFVRDPLDRLHSMQHLGLFWRTNAGHGFARDAPSLMELARSRDLPATFRDSTVMGLDHAVHQHDMLVTADNRFAVDFIGDLAYLPEIMTEALIPALQEHSPYGQTDAHLFDRMRAYFAKRPRLNELRKGAKAHPDELRSARCLILANPAFQPDYKLFYVTRDASNGTLQVCN